jgi:hypothetical protein
MRHFAWIFYGVLFAGVTSQGAFADPCPDGKVPTYCQCHAGASLSYQNCAAGSYCDTNSGICTSASEYKHLKSLESKTIRSKSMSKPEPKPKSDPKLKS